MIGEHAAGHAAEISGNIQVERFLDAIGVKPARFRSGIKRPGICFFPINLTSGFRLYPVDVRRRERDRVDRTCLRSGKRQRLHRVRARIEAHICGSVVHTGSVSGRVDVIGPHFFGAVGQLRLGVDQARNVGPVLHELLVIGFRVDDVANPSKQKRCVGTRANGQPHVGLHRVCGHIRVDYHGFHAKIAAGIGQAVTAMSRL